MSIHVELHVNDFERALEFYGAFGFRQARRTDGAGSSGYMVLELNGSPICFWPGNSAISDQPYFGRFDQNTPRGFGVEIVISVPDLDHAYAVAHRLGSVVEELKIKPWGLRDFRATDPFGYYLRFTEPHDVTESSE